eukprot:Gb_10791 [translate_table: standard]
MPMPKHGPAKKHLLVLHYQNLITMHIQTDANCGRGARLQEHMSLLEGSSAGGLLPHNSRKIEGEKGQNLFGAALPPFHDQQSSYFYKTSLEDQEFEVMHFQQPDGVVTASWSLLEQHSMHFWFELVLDDLPSGHDHTIQNRRIVSTVGKDGTKDVAVVIKWASPMPSSSFPKDTFLTKDPEFKVPLGIGQNSNKTLKSFLFDTEEGIGISFLAEWGNKSIGMKNPLKLEHRVERRRSTIIFKLVWMLMPLLPYEYKDEEILKIGGFLAAVLVTDEKLSNVIQME